VARKKTKVQTCGGGEERGRGGGAGGAGGVDELRHPMPLYSCMAS